ncbi:hypothetical protein MD484_g6331, partial [Candolleomyces efflorescens]
MLPPPGHQVPASTPDIPPSASLPTFNDGSQPTAARQSREEWLNDLLRLPDGDTSSRATQDRPTASSDAKSLQLSNSTFVQTQSTCTPLGPKANVKYQPNSKRDAHKKEVEADVGTVVELAESEEITKWIESLYVDLAEDDDIVEFLATTNLHAGGRWVGIRKDNDGKLSETELYGPYVKIINMILQWFVHKVKDGSETGESSSRAAIDTHVRNLSHQEEESSTIWSRGGPG